MFTGLVSDRGSLRGSRKRGETWTLEIETGYAVEDLELGESIAVDGVCLTVTQIGASSFWVDVSPETLSRTTLGDRGVGDGLHLERALAVGDRLGGHIVQGHVDGVGRVVNSRQEGKVWLLEIEPPAELAQYFVEKGSVTVDGVSLTVNYLRGSCFGLTIIPHTGEQTGLFDYEVGRRVNLEVDIVGKYIERMLEVRFGGRGDGLSVSTLLEAGFGED